MNDCVIIGGGPAGLSAAVYLARQRLKFVLIAEAIGGQALWSASVENYLGFHLLDGMHLVEKFKEHVMSYQEGFLLKEGHRASSVERIEGGFKVSTDKGESFEARTVLIATGEKHRELNVPGERAFYGRGVTYCAMCDGPLYKDKDVAVIGGGNSAMQTALFLRAYAKSVTIMTVNDELKGEATLKKKIEADADIRVMPRTKTTKILGDSFMTGVEYESVDGTRAVLESQGVFIEIGLVPVSDFIDIIKKNKTGEIEVDIHNQTNVPGIWAAGDVTNVTEKQIAVAVGEGCKAALGVMKWLQLK